ncbi:MAG: BamA/TamA family outer membrane protein [Fibrobacter sp.]|nr:BamA/TamA family outer membrane protein [Fibrobacter sp.]
MITKYAKYHNAAFLPYILLVFPYILSANSPTPNVGSITIRGNKTFDTDTLLSFMELQSPFLFSKSAFSSFKLHEDLEALGVFYRSQGFINPIITQKIDFDEVEDNVHIEITINENRRITVSSVNISNSSIFDTKIFPLLKSQTGEPLIYPFVNADVRYILDTLANIGFLKASVKPVLEIDSAKFTAAISFVVFTGPRIFVSDIRIDGLSTVKSIVILRELTFRPKDTLTAKHIKNSQRNIFQTRMFNFVNIFADITDSAAFRFSSDTLVTVVVSVNQAKYFSLDAGIRYGTYERLYSSMDLSYNNFFRIGHTFGFNGQLSGFEQSIGLYYGFPRFLETPFDLNVRYWYKRHDTLFFSIPLAYEGEFNGISLNFGRNFNDIFIFNFTFEHENVIRIAKPQTDSLIENIPLSSNQSISANIVIDKKNNIFTPSKGFLEQLTFRIGGLGSNQFFKFTNNFHWYSSGGPFSITSGIICGLAKGFRKNGSVPVQHQFFGGGAQTVRGYQQDKLITTQSGSPSGGNAELIIHFFDIQFPLFWWFQGAVFLDAGYIWQNINSVSLSDLKFTSGPALRVATPIGLIRIDLGFQLNSTGKDRYQVHLGIGKPF